MANEGIPSQDCVSVICPSTVREKEEVERKWKMTFYVCPSRISRPWPQSVCVCVLGQGRKSQVQLLEQYSHPFCTMEEPLSIFCMANLVYFN